MNFPILSSITFLPFIGALFVFLTRSEKGEKNKSAIYISIFTSFVNFFITFSYGFHLIIRLLIFNLLKKLIG